MVMLKAYDSDTFSSEESNNEILQSQEKEIDSHTVRQGMLLCIPAMGWYTYTYTEWAMWLNEVT